MKIGALDNPSVPTPTGSERRSSPTPAGSAAEPSTRVELSSQAALIGGGAGSADFDAAKVERVAQAIRDGSFRVDAEAIADKLIANAQELLGRRSDN